MQMSEILNKIRIVEAKEAGWINSDQVEVVVGDNHPTYLDLSITIDPVTEAYFYVRAYVTKSEWADSTGYEYGSIKGSHDFVDGEVNIDDIEFDFNFDDDADYAKLVNFLGVPVAAQDNHDTIKQYIIHGFNGIDNIKSVIETSIDLSNYF